MPRGITIVLYNPVVFHCSRLHVLWYEYTTRCYICV